MGSCSMAHRWAETRWNQLETKQLESPMFVLLSCMLAPLASWPGLSLQGVTQHTLPSVSLPVSQSRLGHWSQRGLI